MLLDLLFATQTVESSAPVSSNVALHAHVPVTHSEFGSASVHAVATLLQSGLGNNKQKNGSKLTFISMFNLIHRRPMCFTYNKRKVCKG